MSPNPNLDTYRSPGPEVEEARKRLADFYEQHNSSVFSKVINGLAGLLDGLPTWMKALLMLSMMLRAALALINALLDGLIFILK